MEIDKLAYPWKVDVEEVKYEQHNLQSKLNALESQIQFLTSENQNLKYFCQNLFDRLNLTSYSGGNTINRPY